MNKAPEGVFHAPEDKAGKRLSESVYVANNEYRAPKMGEWYIFIDAKHSEVRRAQDDMQEQYWIAVMQNAQYTVAGGGGPGEEKNKA